MEKREVKTYYIKIHNQNILEEFRTTLTLQEVVEMLNRGGSWIQFPSQKDGELVAYNPMYIVSITQKTGEDK